MAAIAALPAVAIYWDATRRQADRALLWAVAMFFVSWMLVRVVGVGLLYYFVVVKDDSAGGS